MSVYKRNRHRGIQGNLVLTIVTVVIACAVIVSAVLLIQKFSKMASVVTSSKTTSSRVTSSVQITSSSHVTSSVQTTSSSHVTSSAQTSSSSNVTSSAQTSSSSNATSSVQTTSSTPVSPDYFKNSVFVGDSITDGLSLYGEMDKATVVAETGMSAYTSVAHSFLINGKTQKISTATAALNPSKIYLLLGSNDLAEAYTTTTFTKYYSELINELKSKCPNAKIYVQSIFPVTSYYETKKFSSGVYVTNVKIDQFNVALKSMCVSENATYLDVASVLKGPDGKLPLKASDDGMHLRKAYYDKWFAYLGSH